MARTAHVHRLPMSVPSDVSAIEALFASGDLAPDAIVAILGKTEGNGCVNDFTRGYAVQSLRAALAPHLPPDRIDRLPMVMSGGTEGGLSPHWIVLSEADGPDTATGPSLALASAVTRPLSPSEIGRGAQVELVRDAVLTAMKDAGITRPEDVHFVQIKCPLLTSERIEQVAGDVATRDTLKSMGLSRGASALGVAQALGEVGPVPDTAIGSDWSLWSSRASASSGIELMSCEIVVIGLSSDWSGDLAVAHTVMRDAIDAGSIARVLDTIAPGAPIQSQADRLQAVLAKAEASAGGTIRGQRHTMLDDSDISSTRHARGFVGGVLAGLTGLTDLFVSGGAEHQGPDGGGPVCIIYRKDTPT
ncbi:ring-opening amidohydrolase [Alexandriicola marinus]|uniref:cyanuric acid amidohydrolase n=1 Tax=Alexandriicola marinus TaxID=2081710 RepID=UPI000FD84F0C|nr:ring-opening amidohydrolase [Alexandriicola marinus]